MSEKSIWFHYLVKISEFLHLLASGFVMILYLILYFIKFIFYKFIFNSMLIFYFVIILYLLAFVFVIIHPEIKEIAKVSVLSFSF